MRTQCREYELANHLAGETVSNVLATVSDNKTGILAVGLLREKAPGLVKTAADKGDKMLLRTGPDHFSVDR